MKCKSRVFLLDEDGRRFFGEGPYRLLQGVAQTHSLHAAAAEMEMSYSKALSLIRTAEQALGLRLIERSIGGKNGGGSELTATAKELITRYADFSERCAAENSRIFTRCFAGFGSEPSLVAELADWYPRAGITVGCVVLASGEGRRFGGDKLLADFRGMPLLAHTLAALPLPLLEKTLVVTRDSRLAALAGQAGLPARIHALPTKSDTLRIGLSAMRDMEGCMFCVGDQPLLTRAGIERLLLAFSANPDRIVQPTANGRVGSPVIFPKALFPELLALSGDTGGGAVVARHREMVITVELEEKELMDADTPAQLQALEKLQ